MFVKKSLVVLAAIGFCCTQAWASPASAGTGWSLEHQVDQCSQDQRLDPTGDRWQAGTDDESPATHIGAVSIRFTQVPQERIVPVLPRPSGSPRRTASLPALPSTLLLTFAGFICVTLVRDRRAWAALVVAAISVGQAGLSSLPRVLATSERTNVTRVVKPRAPNMGARAPLRTRVGRYARLLETPTGPPSRLLRSHVGGRVSIWRTPYSGFDTNGYSGLAAEDRALQQGSRLAFLRYLRAPCPYAQTVLSPLSERGPPVAA